MRNYPVEENLQYQYRQTDKKDIVTLKKVLETNSENRRDVITHKQAQFISMQLRLLEKGCTIKEYDFCWMLFNP